MEKGDKKVKIHFAYFPEKMSNGKRIWMKEYLVNYICQEVAIQIILKYEQIDGKSGYNPKTIYELQWVEVDRVPFWKDEKVFTLKDKWNCLLHGHDWREFTNSRKTEITGRNCFRCGKKQKMFKKFEND